MSAPALKVTYPKYRPYVNDVRHLNSVKDMTWELIQAHKAGLKIDQMIQTLEFYIDVIERGKP